MGRPDFPTLKSPDRLPAPYGWLARVLATDEQRLHAFLRERPVPEPPSDVVTCVSAQRVAGYLEWRLSGARSACPSTALDAWVRGLDEPAQAEGVASTLRRMQIRRCAEEFLRCLETHGVGGRCLFIKGFPIGAHFYPEDYLRVTADVDVAMDSAQAEVAFKLLDRSGWRLPQGTDEDQVDRKRLGTLKHLLPRCSPQDPETLLEIHTERFAFYSGWDWDRLFAAGDRWIESWPELGGHACRLRAEGELAFAALHLVDHCGLNAFQVLADAGRLLPTVSPDGLQELAACTALRGILAVLAEALGICREDDAWREWARKQWIESNDEERSKGFFVARYFWSAVPGQPRAPFWAPRTFTEYVRYAFQTPDDELERKWSVSRRSVGFQIRRMFWLLGRWGSYCKRQLLR